MAITHHDDIRNSVCNLVVDAIDAGAGAGKLVFRTSGNTAVATLTFSDPAFDAAGTAGGNSVGVATAEPITSDTNAAGGTVAKFTVEDSTTKMVFTGAVSTSGSDINLSSLTVGAGDTVTVSALTYTAMP